jgi:ankyrin repeat protein
MLAVRTPAGSIAFLNTQLDAKTAQSWNVDTKDRSGNTALFHACWGGQLEVVKLLLARGAKVRN